MKNWHAKLKNWHALWYVGTPGWKISPSLARWHAKSKNWHAFGTLERWYVTMRSWHDFDTLACRHLSTETTLAVMARKARDLANSVIGADYALCYWPWLCTLALLFFNIYLIIAYYQNRIFSGILRFIAPGPLGPQS